MPSEREIRTQQWLTEHRPLYERCKRKLEDPEQVLEAWEELAQFFVPVLAFEQSAPPHEAVFVIATLKSNLDSFFKEVLFIKEYREKLKVRNEIQELDGDEPPYNPDELVEGVTADWPT